MPKIKVAVLAATGAVGQRFVQLLDNHPWFQVTALTGSDRTLGRTYAEGCWWTLPGPMPEFARDMQILPTEPGMDAAICFSALPADQAKELEPHFAKAGHVIASNASAHRMWPDVPLLIPEVNPDHTCLIKPQQQTRGWNGALTTNPNCTPGASGTCDIRDYMPTHFSPPSAWDPANDTTGQYRPQIHGGKFIYLGSGNGLRFFNVLLSSPSDGQSGVSYTGWTDVDLCDIRFDHNTIGVLLNSPRFTVRQSQFYGSGSGGAAHGIFGGCDDCVIKGNYFDASCYGTNGVYDHDIYLSETAQGSEVHRMQVKNNEVHGCGSQNAGTVAFVIHGQVTDTLVENNYIVCDNPASGGGSAWGISFDDGGYGGIQCYFDRTTIRRNWIVDFPGLGIQMSEGPDSLIEDNVVIQPTQGGGAIDVGGYPHRVPENDHVNNRQTVRNNTIYYRSTGGTAITIENEGTGHNSANNAVYFVGASGTCFAYTLSAGSYDYLSNNACNRTWNTTYDSNRITLSSSPFENAPTDFTPATGSPILNAGTTATTCTVGGTANQPCYSPVAPTATTWTGSDSAKNRDAQPDVGAYER